MAKIKRGFFWTWGTATVLLILFGWWQTTRLASVSTERDQMRRDTLTTLLTQAEGLLDNAADQVQAKNFGTGQSTAGAAIAMFTAAAHVAQSDLTEQIKARSDQATRLRVSINEGDPDGSSVDLLRSEAAITREMVKKLGAEPEAMD